MTKIPDNGKMSKNALIIFTREPVPGKTKTRLMPYLSPQQCADLHLCFLRDIYREASKTGADITYDVVSLKDDINNLIAALYESAKDFDEKTNYSNYEIIVVDNASQDDSINYLNSLDLPITVIENTENVSFSKGNNDAAKIANGEYLLLLNNDIEPLLQ